MSAKVIPIVAFAVILTAFGMVAPSRAAEEAPEAVILVPDRMLMIEYGFNVARIRDVLLVSYRSYEPRDPLLLHVWDGRKWAAVSLADYKSGAFLPGAPSVVIAIGDNSMLPDSLAAAPSWCVDQRRLPTMNIGELVNQTATILNFRDREWKTMAGIYNLSIVDLNAERRKYGKYGPPGTETKPPAGEISPIDILMPTAAPAPVQEQKAVKYTPPPPPPPPPAKPVVIEPVPVAEPPPPPTAKQIVIEPVPVAEPQKTLPASIPPVIIKPVPVAPAPAVEPRVKTDMPETFDMPLGSEAVEPPAK